MSNSIRAKIYIGLLLLSVGLVLVRQHVVKQGRERRIISTISEWREYGKPVVVREAKKENVREYARFTISPESGTIASGYVTRDIQEKLNQGQEVYLVDQGTEPAGIITGVSGEMDVDTGMFYIQVEVNEKFMTDDGALTVVYVHTNTYPDAIAVPNEILDIDNEEFYVWKISEEKALRVKVEVAARNGYGAIVTGGIEPGDMVICSGQSQLEPEDKVRIVPLKEKCEPGTTGEAQL